MSEGIMCAVVVDVLSSSRRINKHLNLMCVYYIYNIYGSFSYYHCRNSI